MARTFTSRLPAGPVLGSNRSWSVRPITCSAAASRGSMVCRSPRMLAICAWASSSRGRDRTTSGGRAGSQLWMVACSPRRLNTESKCSSTSRAAHSGSPAARACRTASSGSPCCGVPRRGVAVQAPAALRFQPGPQQIGEQMVIPPPAADVVELDHEQAGPVRFFEQVLAVVAAGDGVAQGPAEALEHRRLEEEAAELGTLLFEDLLGQVVKDVPVAAGERGHEAGDVGLAAQRQGRQLQARRPALGPFGQGGRQPGRRRRPRPGRAAPPPPRR